MIQVPKLSKGRTGGGANVLSKGGGENNVGYSKKP